jgi:hypothetical protein
LKNVAERMVVRARSGLEVSDLPREVRDDAAAAEPDHAHMPGSRATTLYDRSVAAPSQSPFVPICNSSLPSCDHFCTTPSALPPIQMLSC